MKFKGEPNLSVTVARTKPLKVLTFDKNGILEIDDSRFDLIRRLKVHFKVVNEEKKEKPKTTSKKKEQ